MLPFTTKFFFSPSYAFALGGFCLLGSAFFFVPLGRPAWSAGWFGRRAEFDLLRALEPHGSSAPTSLVWDLWILFLLVTGLRR